MLFAPLQLSTFLPPLLIEHVSTVLSVSHIMVKNYHWHRRPFSECLDCRFPTQVSSKLEQLVFRKKVEKVLVSQKKFIAPNADRYMAKWANRCITVVSASGTAFGLPFASHGVFVMVFSLCVYLGPYLCCWFFSSSRT
jgi:hypothetical protein